MLFRVHFSFTFSLYVSDPTGITTILSLLNFAPDAAHHLSRIRILKRVSGLSFSDREMVASSAKSARMTPWYVSWVVILRPDNSLDVLSRWDIGSMAMLKRRQDSGSPCHMPLMIWNFLLISPFRITAVSAFEYRDFMVFTRLFGMFIASRVCH